ncbi:acyltransferase-like protein At1g54570, chloroplastic isoform X2 [Dioscorea cayenensis subsp. rotundata]|nr:acyltransferase-like protein At1g54570, chloroplastic isoform X2 [Dioscorea cayenensis subsp. rotundata]
MAMCSCFHSFIPSWRPISIVGVRRNHSILAISESSVKNASGVGEVELASARAKIGDSHIEKKGSVEIDAGDLGVLYEDGFGTMSVEDYFSAAKQIIKPDGGPPRWFCPVECGKPIKNAPLLLFLPGADGTGVGLILHHKSLGKAFEVRCMHVPINDRTPFEGLVSFVEHTVRFEQAMSPNKPIYLLGDSLGGCLALAVAARNPTIDLVLILVNPATSFGKSQVQPLIPVLEGLPSNLHNTVPYLLSFVMGDPVKMAMTSVPDDLAPPELLNELSNSLTSLLPYLSDLADIIPRETFLWKLKLLKSAAAYVNSRLHAVEADVLLLASGKDNLLPSGDEAERLCSSLKKCRIRYFKDNGHTLLLEDGINLLTIIKGTYTYRRSKRCDFVDDYLPPTMHEFKKIFEQEDRLFRVATSPVTLSTLKDGKIVRGLDGVPGEGPVLFVGYHMLMGLELGQLYEEFLRERKIALRGMAHPALFYNMRQNSRPEFSRFDYMNVFGALPVSPANIYRLLSRKAFVLLYPGGAREALHRKGEEYKLFWPDQPEFVRMAARFEATIVPFGVVGEDDVAELFIDYDDLMSNPFTKKWVEDFNKDAIRLRSDVGGELAQQEIYIPGLLPKVPGRFYYLFGRPTETRGMKDVLSNRDKANALYLQIKSEVERTMSYLRRKREEDPYRSIIPRIMYEGSWGFKKQAPTFDF